MDRLIRTKINEVCQLSLIPSNKMAQMIDRYVVSNETHGLETFIDHEVFRRSYHEIRRSIIDQPTTVQSLVRGGSSTSADLEKNIREKVRTYLHTQF